MFILVNVPIKEEQEDIHSGYPDDIPLIDPSYSLGSALLFEVFLFVRGETFKKGNRARHKVKLTNWVGRYAMHVTINYLKCSVSLFFG